MDLANWLRCFIFSHARLPDRKPDGRPLYAYRCIDKYYGTLKEALSGWPNLQTGSLNLPPDRSFHAAFCLYAAETFRREHRGGVWAWNTIFEPLAIPVPDNPVLYDWITTGLAWWGRTVLVNPNNGHHLYLVTIACEGGLPLHLLNDENSRLRQFFNELLASWYRHGMTTLEDAELQAEELARQILPPTLRVAVVHRLSAELITHIVRLQASLPDDTVNPIEELNQRNPNWRHQLPLRADDHIIENLLSPLLKNSRKLASAGRVALKWTGELKSAANGFQVGKMLELPEHLTASQLAVSPETQAPPRLYLTLRTPHSDETVARLTRIGQEGDDIRYRRETLQRGGIRLTGTAVGRVHPLLLNLNGQERHLPVKGEGAWSETLPWVFIPRPANERLEWLAEGSVRTRSAEAWVAVTAATQVEPQEGGGYERLGEMAGVARVVYRISGAVRFIVTDMHETVQVTCGAPQDTALDYVVMGQKVHELLDATPVYRGLPRLQARDETGHYLANGTLIQQWKPVNVQTDWQTGYLKNGGTFWLRLIDTNGLVHNRQQIVAVPPDFQIERTPVDENGGRYQLTGLAGADVRVLHPAAGGCEVEPIPNGYRIVCPLLPQADLPDLHLVLNWAGLAHVPLHLPYPQRGVSLRLAGRPLSHDERVPLGRLGGLQLLIQDAIGAAHYWLDATLVSRDVAGNRYAFREKLPLPTQGRLALHLQSWYDRIVSLMACTASLDAHVRLDIGTGHQVLASVQIARFDMELKPDHAAGTVQISPADQARLEAGQEQCISVEMIRLWQPSAAAVSLLPVEQAAAIWQIPPDLEPGPWWVIAREGQWARFRPLLKTIRPADGEVEQMPADLRLADIIRIANAAERNQQMDQLLAAMGHSSSHPDWPLLFDYFSLTREFPPGSLDVIQRLIQHPETLALALMRADEQTFGLVWALAETMPFSWGLLPVRTWAQVADRYFGELKTALAGVSNGEDIVFDCFCQFRERVSNQRKYWNGLCDGLQLRLFPGRALNGVEWTLAQQYPDMLEQQIPTLEQELQGRHYSDWPLNDTVMDFIGHLQSAPAWHTRYQHLGEVHHAVRYAPYLAAHIALNGIEPPAALIYELRLLRQFDTEWFDQVYAIQLVLGLAEGIRE